MKKSFYILAAFIILSIFPGCEDKADELPSIIYISSQSDIDKYAHLLEDLEVFEGGIVFQEDASFDLSVFAKLVSTGGVFSVKTQEQLDAFINLREVNGLILDYSGHVIISNIQIVNGPLLTNLATRVDAPSLKRLNFRYIVSDKVEILGDFSNLEYVRELWMQHDNLAVIEDFSSLVEVEIFNLSNSEIEIRQEAFRSIRLIDELQLFCINQETEINISWLQDLQASRFMDIYGPFDKFDVCEYIYPISDLPTEFFQVRPSDQLLESMDLEAGTTALGSVEVAQLCEN